MHAVGKPRKLDRSKINDGRCFGKFDVCPRISVKYEPILTRVDDLESDRRAKDGRMEISAGRCSRKIGVCLEMRLFVDQFGRESDRRGEGKSIEN